MKYQRVIKISTEKNDWLADFWTRGTIFWRKDLFGGPSTVVIHPTPWKLSKAADFNKDNDFAWSTRDKIEINSFRRVRVLSKKISSRNAVDSSDYESAESSGDEGPEDIDPLGFDNIDHPDASAKNSIGYFLPIPRNSHMPFPGSCGARFAANGSLVCFFSHPEREAFDS
jgi:hypothetical protein